MIGFRVGFRFLGSTFRWKATLINVKNAFLMIEASDDVNVPSCFARCHHYGFHGYATQTREYIEKIILLYSSIFKSLKYSNG